MKSSLGSATLAQKKRWQYMQDTGCICHQILGLPSTPGEMHHLLDTGRRISHDHTICISPYHHRGIIPDGMTEEQAREVLGPSYAKEPKRFAEVFGTDEELLEYQNQVVEIVKKSYI